MPYICIEGADGTGTTTVTRALYDYLTERGVPAIHTHEPHDLDETGPLIRKYLRAAELTAKERKALCHLYVANRTTHMDLVQQWLDDGLFVLSDRCFLSTLVYQGLSAYSLHYLDMLHEEDSLIKPSIILLLHGAWKPKDQAKRLDNRGSTEELFEKTQFRKSVWDRYGLYSKQCHALHVPIVTIDAWKPLTEVINLCKSYVGVVMQCSS